MPERREVNAEMGSVEVHGPGVEDYLGGGVEEVIVEGLGEPEEGEG